jgi:ABC-type multidrug transport system ATPase subunit
MQVLQTQTLSKHYGRIKAIQELGLRVEKGQIFGILGPNGSGKTTTLGIVLGIIRASSGSYSWFGREEGQEDRRNIGALLETPNFYPFLSAMDNLRIVAHIKKASDAKLEELLELVHLAHRKNDPFRTYSLGMKQRLAIASALVGDPDVLIFDEPTNGLDPQGIAEVRNTLQTIAQRGHTIIMASHILDEVEKICSHVGILKSGRLLATGPVGAILSNDQILEIGAQDPAALRELAASLPKVNQVTTKGSLLELTVDPDFEAAEINRAAFEKGIVLTHLLIKQRSLEEEFLEITKD